jgi:hypothetical protein
LASTSHRNSSRSAAVTGVSWLALVAATTLGSGQFGQVRAQVSTRGGPATSQKAGMYRLVVQSYDARSVTAGSFPAEHARPLGATQRAVTAEELERGVSIDVLHVGVGAARTADSVVVAWVEPGLPNLEFDALTARPAADAVYGVGRSRRGSGAQARRVVLERRFGAA